MLAYNRRTGEKITYEDLADMTGIATGTLQSIGGRPNYRPTLANVEKLCRALEVPLHEMLEMIDDPPKRKPTSKKKKKRKKEARVTKTTGVPLLQAVPRPPGISIGAVRRPGHQAYRGASPVLGVNPTSGRRGNSPYC